MPHSLRVKIKNLRYKGIITDKDCDRLITALDNKDVLDKIRAEFISLYPMNYLGEPDLGGSCCVFSLNKVLNIIDKYKNESEVQDAYSN